MKIEVQFCFKHNAISGKEYIKFYEDFVRFTPYSFRKNLSTKPWKEKVHLKAIANAKSTDSIGVIDLDSGIFSAGEAGYVDQFHNIGISQDSDVFFPTNSEIEAKINESSFVSAFMFYSEYVKIQGLHNSKNAEHLRIDADVWDTLRDTPSKPGDFGGIAYDVRYNPGRLQLAKHTWLVAAWKMWFGTHFFKLIPKEKILSFSDAFTIKELPDGKIFVQLYEKVEESVSVENMIIQQKWREWLGYNELVLK